MDEHLRVICAMDGVFLRREAEALGLTQSAIARLCRQGVWRRVRTGAYTFEDIWAGMSRDERYSLRTRAVLKQARTPVVLSHTSAVSHHGGPLWGLDLDLVHLTRRDGRTGRKERGVQQHRGRILPGDVVERDHVPVMSATRTAIEITTVATLESALCVIEDFLHRGLTSASELRERYQAMERWPHTLGTDLALRLADPRSESVGESRVGYLCWSQGLPKPVRQFEVYDDRGVLVAVLDFAWPEHGVFLEFDGRVKYEKLLGPGESPVDAVVREKRREDLVRDLTGWRCVRLAWPDLGRPRATAGRIRNALAWRQGAA